MGILFGNTEICARLLATGKVEEHVLVAVPNHPIVDERIADHADLSLFGGDKIYGSPNVYDVVYSTLSQTFDKEWLTDNLVKGMLIPEGDYPKDILYNCVEISGKLFHSLQHTDPVILQGYGGEKVNMKQGYSKCSCLLIGKSAVITEDPGVEKLLKSRGIDVLRINRGGVHLCGFEYGFIGGAGGSVGSILFINGKLSTHAEYHLIKPFLLKHGIESVELHEGPLIDCGSILYFDLCNTRKEVE